MPRFNAPSDPIHYLWFLRFSSCCRSSKVGEVAAAGKRLQSPADAPESHAVHAAEPPRGGAHGHPLARGDAASRSAETRREYDEESDAGDGGDRKVSRSSPGFSRKELKEKGLLPITGRERFSEKMSVPGEERFIWMINGHGAGVPFATFSSSDAFQLCSFRRGKTSAAGGTAPLPLIATDPRALETPTAADRGNIMPANKKGIY